MLDVFKADAVDPGRQPPAPQTPNQAGDIEQEFAGLGKTHGGGSII